MTKSTKQKETSRQLIASDISYLSEPLCKSGNWNINPCSFQSSELMPLDVAQFDRDSERYHVVHEDEGSTITEDDVIVQAMVVSLLYRMEKGWGKARSCKALSIWSGKPANANDVDDDFPLDNLWHDEVQSLIRHKKLGKTTLGHNDNFDNFPRLYACSKDRWARRSDSYIGTVHIFAEQAAIQMALHLHENVSGDYALLAATIIHYALESDGDTGDSLMIALARSLLESARKESDNFPKMAYDDILAAGQKFEKVSNDSQRKRQKC